MLPLLEPQELQVEQTLVVAEVAGPTTVAAQ
jgi:hypothetical protein